MARIKIYKTSLQGCAAAAMFTVFVALEGFHLKNFGFIVKEMTVVYPTGSEYDHFLFESPSGVPFAEGDQQTVNFCTNKIHGLHWDEGTIPYQTVFKVLDGIRSCHIVCHGCAASQFIKKHLPNSKVTDTASLGHVLPRTILKRPCGRKHRGRNCSLSKAFYIMENFE